MNAKVSVSKVSLLIVVAIAASSASLMAQSNSPSPTLTPLYPFFGLADGASPNEVILDPAGNLYGATYYGGNLQDNCQAGPSGSGCGVVFKINSRGHESVLRSFTGADGGNPYAGVFRDSSGILYTVTSTGGANGGGSAIKLRPPATFCASVLCPWSETVLHNFLSMPGDGAGPNSDLIRDGNGNLYGVTSAGGGSGCGSSGCGTVFKIDSQGNESVLYSFRGSPDGAGPIGALLEDSNGNLFGVTVTGGPTNANCTVFGTGCGTVFELSPSGSGWTERVVYPFTGGADGQWPQAGLISDGNGNLYGTAWGGSPGAGVVFELTPSASGWTQSVLHSFTGPPDGEDPVAKLLMDASGNLYGTTFYGGVTSSCLIPNGAGCGTVFELSPGASGWNETILWPFSGGTDGSYPAGPVVMDSQGTLYGATLNGGDLNSQNPACSFNNTRIGCGIVFKLTP